MNVFIWVMEILVGVFFAFYGTLLLRPDPARLQSGMSYILEMASPLRIFSGAAEGLAGIASSSRPSRAPRLGWCRSPRPAAWS
ncbi:MAG TPA: hypothetical protein VGR61_11375 [Candidatus Dormibacteraeota bacterium]|nr:hypothetical protein [Candidatus Dormibacteraeota bacterium]